MSGSRAFALRSILAGALVCLAGATAATAQAWLPPRGEAALTLGYNRMWATEHIDYRGNPNSPGDMIWNNIGLDLSYGVTDRFAVRVSLPFVISKYDGAFPHPVIAGVRAQDDGRYHSRFQDVTTEIRYRVPAGSFAVTPFAGLVVPSHSYPSYGHGAAGRNLTEGRFGLSAGRLLDPLLPDAYLQVRYTYSMPEKVLGISHNASSLGADLGYLVGSSLTLRTFGIWQKTHGGWRAPIDFPARTSPDFLHHDQVQRTEYFRLGGAVAYSLTNAIDINVFGYSTIHAKSDINMKSLGIALTWSASPAQLIRKKRAVKPASP
jgi:hypothetical protein